MLTKTLLVSLNYDYSQFCLKLRSQFFTET